MGKKLNLAIIAMLGFSSACSSSRKTQASPENDEAQTDVPTVIEPRIRVMYGVPYPRPAILMPVEEQSEATPDNQGDTTDTANTPDTADSADAPDTTDNAQKSE